MAPPTNPLSGDLATRAADEIIVVDCIEITGVRDRLGCRSQWATRLALARR